MSNRLFQIITFLVLIVLAIALEVQSANIQVSWNANTESDLAGYKLYYGTASGVYGAPVDVGNVTSYTITITPTAGTKYYFALTAYDTSGNESLKSDEASVFIPDGTPPAKPTGLMQRIIAWLKSIFRVKIG